MEGRNLEEDYVSENLHLCTRYVMQVEMLKGYYFGLGLNNDSNEIENKKSLGNILIELGRYLHVDSLITGASVLSNTRNKLSHDVYSVIQATEEPKRLEEFLMSLNVIHSDCIKRIKEINKPPERIVTTLLISDDIDYED